MPSERCLRVESPALVVLEGGALPSRSKLRTLLEAADDGAAIGCYPEEGRALEATIRATLQEAGVGIDPDALSWLSRHLGADLASTRAELGKAGAVCRPRQTSGHRCRDDLRRRSCRAVAG